MLELVFQRIFRVDDTLAGAGAVQGLRQAASCSECAPAAVTLLPPPFFRCERPPAEGPA